MGNIQDDSGDQVDRQDPGASENTITAIWFSQAFRREAECFFLTSLSTDSNIHVFLFTENVPAKTAVLIYRVTIICMI